MGIEIILSIENYTVNRDYTVNTMIEWLSLLTKNELKNWTGSDGVTLTNHMTLIHCLNNLSYCVHVHVLQRYYYHYYMLYSVYMYVLHMLQCVG